ncbi:MAG: NAD(P)/FAD-dependent oxidoreductase, partial [Mycobacteriaceae bacterium]
MTSQPVSPTDRIVIIGAGVVGAALADELVLRGASDVTLIDQGPLYSTGGSSSHAPGFVFQTNASRAMCALAQRTMDKLDGLDLDGAPLVSRVGGLEIATTDTQLTELTRRLGFAHANGLPAEIIGPDRVKDLWPDLDTSLVLAALHTPTDGVVHAARAVEFQARRAEAGGATVLGLTRVTDVLTEEGRGTGGGGGGGRVAGGAGRGALTPGGPPWGPPPDPGGAPPPGGPPPLVVAATPLRRTGPARR